MSYGAEAPLQWYGLPEAERKQRAKLSSDQCVIDNEWFYVKGNIEIPVKGSGEAFIWTVWVSLSHDSFDRASKHWDEKGREREPAYFGWLSTGLPAYPDTVNLKTQVISRERGLRFKIELEPTDHPLAVEQREGITWERIQEIAEKLLHP